MSDKTFALVIMVGLVAVGFAFGNLFCTQLRVNRSTEQLRSVVDQSRTERRLHDLERRLQTLEER